MRRLLVPISLALVVAASAGCRQADLPVLAEAPAFHLVNEDGAAIDAASLEGRPWLASFLYTSCPGPCPRLVERLKLVRRTIPAGDLAFVSFTVDPATDTPDVLRKYKADHGIGTGDNWTFVTGPPSDVTTVIEHGFLTGVSSAPAGSPEGGVTHGTRVALVDRNRHVRGFYSTEDDADLARLERDAAAIR